MDDSTMSPARLRDALGREIQVLAELFDRVAPDAPVTSCPGWLVRDLQAHLAGALRFWTIAVERPGLERAEVRELGAAIRAEVAERFLSNAEAFTAAIDARQPEDAAWSWAPDRTVGFVTRRIAHELAVHRYDAELAAGSPTPVDAELASDGIDEFLVVWTARRPADAGPIGGSLHLHCTDVAGEWMVREGADERLTVTREHAKGDAAARGSASDLLLALWHRRDLSTLDVLGDEAVLRRFVDRRTI